MAISLKPIKSKTFHIITLGCPKNTVDSEVLRGYLDSLHYRWVSEPEAADIVFINTCGFIQPAKEESIETILEMADHSANSGQEVIVMGCLSQRYPDQLREELPEIDALYGVDQQEQIVRDLTMREGGCPAIETARILLTPGHYAYLKIAEGCDNTCSFCAIPFIRGRQISRSVESLRAEAEYLARQGVKELILIAQDVTRYGSDLKGNVNLEILLEALLALHRFTWIRVLYTHPDFLSPTIAHLFQHYPELCPYLDIPLQHAAPRILQLMGRGANPAMIRDRLRQLRRQVPNIALRSSVMVGFPSETKSDFEQLMDFLEELRFERLGVFTYSEEEGTAAARYKDSIPPAEKERRRELIMRIQWGISQAFARSKLGQRLPVLIDRREGQIYIGRTVWDAPEIDATVRINSSEELRIGEFHEVLITDIDGIDLVGKTISESP